MKPLRPHHLIPLILMLAAQLTPAAAADWVYTMRPGDNLWSLAERHLKSVAYVEPLARHNGLEDPLHIPPGTRISIPVEWSTLEPAAVELDEVYGDVRYRAGAGGQLLSLGTEVKLGLDSEVVTGADGNARLRFADGSFLDLGPNSAITLDKLSAFGDSGMVDSRIRLLEGELEFKVRRKTEGKSLFEVETPSAVNAVRGTEFRVRVDTTDPATRTEVTEGRVAVSAEGRHRSVPKNFGVVVRQGKPPAPPRPLLEAPDLSAIPKRFEQVSFPLQWPAINQAVSYRIRISASNEFKAVAFDRVADQHKVSVSGLPDGDYYVTVRATDEVGLQGLDGLAAFTLDARPEPPVTLKPQPDEIVRANPPVFRWGQTEGANSYHLQVSRDPQFQDPVVDIPDLRKAEIRTEPLPNGHYFWRIALTDASGDRGPYCPPIAFEMREPPASLAVAPPEVSDDRISLAWARFEGVRYVFQLARDPAFDNILVDAVLDEPRITMPKLVGGRYFLRIATIDDTGYRSDFGPTAHVDIPFRR